MSGPCPVRARAPSSPRRTGAGAARTRPGRPVPPHQPRQSPRAGPGRRGDGRDAQGPAGPAGGPAPAYLRQPRCRRSLGSRAVAWSRSRR
ncbi:hypothetical protein DDW44_03760 [Streptomyces tirandamycinicus]|uniref:Uncharacterized protein n=1 Tax=Streptomyces tirandamycinicus TaxID=2174846 RepID=A0A2S1SNQ5_9ACTN|nr:hypothetical protein DDW44_03760 [Streptomyces tirandamycinicus]